MRHATEVEHIATSRKIHRCSWCDQRIDTGQPYKRWRWFDNGDASTCRLHPECYDVMQEEAKEEGGWFEWTPGQDRPIVLAAEQKAKGQDHG